MYVRIAQFEGAQGIDSQLGEIRASIESGRQEARQGGGHPGMRAIQRVVVGVDRDGGRVVNLIFCETEDELRAADEFLSGLDPHEGGGRRTSVAMYEVGIDETLR